MGKESRGEIVCLSGSLICFSRRRRSVRSSCSRHNGRSGRAAARLGSVLVKLGFLTQSEVTNFVSRQYGIPAVDLSYFEIDPAVIKLIPYEVAKRYEILPLSRVGSSLTIAMADPTNVFALDDIKFMTGYNVEPVVVAESEIMEGDRTGLQPKSEDNLESVIASLDGHEANLESRKNETEMNLEDLEKAADQAPIVKLVNMILTDAVKRGASDIHLEPYEKEYRVRFRMDGVLQDIMTPAA